MLTANSTPTDERRPLRLRMRPDLSVREQTYRGRRYWTIKDPLQLRYYRFEEEEFYLLQLLDGQVTPAELQRAFVARFAPQQITLEEIQRLIGLLFRSNLLLSDVPGQGHQLLRRRSEQRWNRWWSGLANPLSIRIPLCGPDRLLSWLDRSLRWLYSPWALVLQCLLIVAALGLVAAEYHEVCRRLPRVQEFFGAANWFWLALALAVTKVLHEFGHGLACKRLGGECHEMGVLWLVFTPCLYCDVSDSWILPNKWHRAAIGAAGMYVELVLAAGATWVWWFTQDGLVHHLSLAVMSVCSISTLIFNANPLMRYDGYYILGDLLEVPNLRQKASQATRQWWCRWILHVAPTDESAESLHHQAWFVIYAMASFVYSWVLFLSIAWLLCHVLEPYGLQIVGQLLAIGIVGGTVVSAGRQIWQTLEQESIMKSTKRTAAHWRLVAIIASLLLLLFLPLPYRVTCDVYLDARDAASVYVDVPGELHAVAASAGDLVAAGDLLCELENTDLRLSRQELEGQRAQAEARLRHLRHTAYANDAALAELTQVEQNLASLEERLGKLDQDRARLRIHAARAGILVPPPRVADQDRHEGKLGSWHGTPLEPRNRGAYLAEGTLIGRIATPGHFLAILALAQHQVPFVQPGQRVDLFLEQSQGRRYPSSLAQVARREITAPATHPATASHRTAGTRPIGADRNLVSATRFEASVPFDDPHNLLIIGGRGQARIHAGYRSPAARLGELFFRTFADGNG